jgi:hypothetical protein
MLEAAEFSEGHGAALMALAEIFRLVCRDADAKTLLRRAIDVFDRKGIVVSADKTRRMLNEPPDGAAPLLTGPLLPTRLAEEVRAFCWQATDCDDRGITLPNCPRLCRSNWPTTS